MICSNILYSILSCEPVNFCFCVVSVFNLPSLLFILSTIFINLSLPNFFSYESNNCIILPLNLSPNIHALIITLNQQVPYNCVVLFTPHSLKY